MTDVVGVRFKRAGRVYYFSPAGIPINVNDYVVVDTTRGQEIAVVVIAPHQVLVSEIQEPLKPILRKAEPEDLRRKEEFRGKEVEALAKCREMVVRLKIPMKPLEADYNLDGNKVTVFFSAEERVDFRDLLRELSAALKSRVELRQTGPRDATKIWGGMGRCGLPLCCATWICEFNPVSIKMAKEQELPLGTSNLAGACGRLKCCIRFEYEQYRAVKKNMPKIGERVMTPMGPGMVVVGHPVKETVTLFLESETTVELHLAQIKREATPQETPEQPEAEEESPEDSQLPFP